MFAMWSLKIFRVRLSCCGDGKYACWVGVMKRPEGIGRANPKKSAVGLGAVRIASQIDP